MKDKKLLIRMYRLSVGDSQLILREALTDMYKKGDLYGR